MCPDSRFHAQKVRKMFLFRNRQTPSIFQILITHPTRKGKVYSTGTLCCRNVRNDLVRRVLWWRQKAHNYGQNFAIRVVRHETVTYLDNGRFPPKVNPSVPKAVRRIRFPPSGRFANNRPVDASFPREVKSVSSLFKRNPRPGTTTADPIPPSEEENNETKNTKKYAT